MNIQYVEPGELFECPPYKGCIPVVRETDHAAALAAAQKCIATLQSDNAALYYANETLKTNITEAQADAAKFGAVLEETREELAANAAMLAKQTDLARAAECAAMEATAELAAAQERIAELEAEAVRRIEIMDKAGMRCEALMDERAELRAELAKAQDDKAAIEGLNPHVLSIAEERDRQVQFEGFNANHDSGQDHANGELAQFAAWYAMPSTNPMRDTLLFAHLYPGNWDTEHNKKFSKSRRRQLVIAGALIVAELDRLAAVTAALDAGKEKNDDQI